MPNPTALPSLVDAHVHLYPSFPTERVLDAASANFRRAAERLRLGATAPPILVLADKARTAYFRALRDGAEQLGRGWTVHRTAEDASLLVTRDADDVMIVLAGRQIATSDTLEALALGVDAEFEEGRPLRETLETVVCAGAVAVVPWGFGKWWMRRGALVRDILSSPLANRIFIGDNGSRPRGFPRSSIFDDARRRGVWSLPGTDPLPFAWEATRPGSFGFVLDGHVEPALAARSVKRLLQALREQPRTFGSPEPIARALLHQSALQLRKRALQLRDTAGGGRRRTETGRSEERL